MVENLHWLLRLEYMLAWVSNNDLGRAIARVCLSATKVCYGRCIASRFVLHSWHSHAVRGALGQWTWRKQLPLCLLLFGSRQRRINLSGQYYHILSICSSCFGFLLQLELPLLWLLLRLIVALNAMQIKLDAWPQWHPTQKHEAYLRDLGLFPHDRDLVAVFFCARRWIAVIRRMCRAAFFSGF